MRHSQPGRAYLYSWVPQGSLCPGAWLTAWHRAWMLQSRSTGLKAVFRSNRKMGRPTTLGTFKTRRQTAQEFFSNKIFNLSFLIWIVLTFHRHLHPLSRYPHETGDWKACFMIQIKGYSLSITHNFNTLGSTFLKKIHYFIFYWPVLVTWKSHFSNAMNYLPESS